MAPTPHEGRAQLRAALGSAVVLVFAGLLGAAAVAAPETQAQTTEGALAGLWQPGYRLFQGIPYAEPPVGNLRWRAPQTLKPWTGVRPALQPGAECVQQAIFWRPGSPASWREDCLYLNVYAPPVEAGPKHPVLVPFHGGGWVNGAGTDVQPTWLAAEGNVVVTVNYRLGALGYLAAPVLDAESADKQSSGQYGDLDKVEALRWVQTNISAFGGDPERVTIAGQSAGAGSVCWLMASPAAKGLFQRAVIQSIGGCANIDHREATQRGERFAQSIGCADAAGMAECLRSKSPAEIIDAQIAAGIQWRPAQGGVAQPTLALAAFAAGDFNRTPVIIGNTRHETRAFVYEGNDLVKQPVTAAFFEAAVRKEQGANAERVLAAYPLASGSAPGATLAAVETDAHFACNAVPVIAALAKWAPVYAYEFRDETSPARPYMVVPPSFPIAAGHTSDVPYVWQSETTVPLTPTQMTLARIMFGFWSNFAAVGDPNGASLPVWPRYDAQAPQRIGFLAGGGAEEISGDAYAEEHHCALWDALTPGTERRSGD
jgi:para-nitrobenzyl esterase